MPLTPTKIERLRPRAKPYPVADQHGLYIDVMPSGSKVWRYKYQLAGKFEKATIGQWPVWDIEMARAVHLEYRRMVKDGKSPAAQIRADKAGLGEGALFEAFAKIYLAAKVTGKVTAKQAATITRWLDRDCYPQIGKIPLRELEADPRPLTAIVWARHDQGHPAAAHKILKLLAAIFDYAAARGLVASNPMDAIDPTEVYTYKRRKVTLEMDDLGRFLRAAYASNIRPQFKYALHLLVLTLVRKMELMGATWDELAYDLETQTGVWTIPGGRVKTGDKHIVYLPRQAVDLFEQLRRLAFKSAYVMPGRLGPHQPFAHNVLNAAIAQIRTINPELPAITVHDLRRTAASRLHDAGWPISLIEQQLNHALPGTGGVYVQGDSPEQRLKMVTFWADQIDALLTASNVVAGRFRGTAA